MINHYDSVYTVNENDKVNPFIIWNLVETEQTYIDIIWLHFQTCFTNFRECIWKTH